MTEYQRIEEKDRRFRKIMRCVLWGTVLILLAECAVMVYLLYNPLPY